MHSSTSDLKWRSLLPSPAVSDSWLLLSECQNPLNPTESSNVWTKVDEECGRECLFNIKENSAFSSYKKYVKDSETWTVIDLFVCQVRFRVIFLLSSTLDD